MRNPVRVLTSIVLLCCTGCTTLPSGRGWGEGATARPGWERVREAAIDAATDPWVWAPLAGAAVLQIDDWDTRAADWAREHTPIFGDTESARQWSDDLRSTSAYVHYATILATPSGSTPSEWLLNKAKGTLVHVAAVSSTGFVTNRIKDATDRERPNGYALESFPSGHTSSSAVHTRLASRNLESIAMSDEARRVANVGLYALTFGTSWARIEAGWHYPADTLAGMALGNFLASFFNDAFLGTQTATLAVTAEQGGWVAQWRWTF